MTYHELLCDDKTSVNSCKIVMITYENPEQAPNGECWKETPVSLHFHFLFFSNLRLPYLCLSFLTSVFPDSVLNMNQVDSDLSFPPDAAGELGSSFMPR